MEGTYTNRQQLLARKIFSVQRRIAIVLANDLPAEESTPMIVGLLEEIRSASNALGAQLHQPSMDLAGIFAMLKVAGASECLVRLASVHDHIKE